MGRARLKVNWNVIHDMLKANEIQDLVREETRRIDEKAAAMGSQTRVDFSAEGERARGAVIAGYEDEATAQRTRLILLHALDG